MGTVVTNFIENSSGDVFSFRGVAKVLLQYDQTVPNIDSSSNVTSVTDESAGEFTVNYTNNMSNNDYSSPMCSGAPSGSTKIRYAGVCLDLGSVTTSSLPVQSARSDLDNEDTIHNMISIFGDIE